MMGKKTVAILAFFVGFLVGAFYPWPKPTNPCYLVNYYDNGKFVISLQVSEDTLGHNSNPSGMSAEIERCPSEMTTYLETKGRP